MSNISQKGQWSQPEVDSSWKLSFLAISMFYVWHKPNTVDHHKHTILSTKHGGDNIMLGEWLLVAGCGGLMKAESKINVAKYSEVQEENWCSLQGTATW